MKRLICTVGLPRSGKSTWAMACLRYHGGGSIVCPDAVRLAIHGQPFILAAEAFVWATVRAMVAHNFLVGLEPVILDSTNITRKHRDSWRSPLWDTEFYAVETHVDVCVQRAGAGTKLAEVIRDMAARYEPLAADEPTYVPF